MLRSRILVAAVAVAAVLLPGAAAAPSAATQFTIVFERNAGTNSHVVVTTEKGSPQTDLTRSRVFDDQQPAFSPDGKRVVFTSDRKGKFELWVMNVDGTGQRRITTSAGQDVNPVWSPDSTRIAFASSANHGNWDIWVVNANGSGRRALTQDSAQEYDAAWSPDSKQIVYDRIDQGASDLFIVNAKGGTPRDATPQTPLDELDPSWGKNGLLAFDAQDAKGNYDIYVTKPFSREATRLTSDPAEDSAPAWSPDAAHLLFVSARTGDYEIWEMDAQGGSPHDVSNKPNAADVAPNWALKVPTQRVVRTLAVAARGQGNFPCGLPMGTAGNDDGAAGDPPIIDGNGNANRLCGFGGKDIIKGEANRDLLDGGPANDALYGNSNTLATGGDTIYARANTDPDKDTISGGSGPNDTCYWDPTKDTILDCEHPRTTA